MAIHFQTFDANFSQVTTLHGILPEDRGLCESLSSKHQPYMHERFLTWAFKDGTIIDLRQKQMERLLYF